MSSVISVRVPRELKDKMREIKVNWSEEIRKFIEQTIANYEAKKTIQEVKKVLRDVEEIPPGTIAEWISLDRKSH